MEVGKIRAERTCIRVTPPRLRGADDLSTDSKKCENRMFKNASMFTRAGLTRYVWATTGRYSMKWLEYYRDERIILSSPVFLPDSS